MDNKTQLALNYITELLIHIMSIIQIFHFHQSTRYECVLYGMSYVARGLQKPNLIELRGTVLTQRFREHWDIYIGKYKKIRINKFWVHYWRTALEWYKLHAFVLAQQCNCLSKVIKDSNIHLAPRISTSIITIMIVIVIITIMATILVH